MTPCSRVINIGQSTAAPYREICLIKLGEMIGVRLDGVSCPDGSGGWLNAAGGAARGAGVSPRAPAPLAPTDGSRGT